MAAAAKMYNKPPKEMEKKESSNAVRIRASHEETFWKYLLNSSAIAKTCQSPRGAISARTTWQLHIQVNESNAQIIEGS